MRKKLFLCLEPLVALGLVFDRVLGIQVVGR
jgi:hypothetical protein